MNLRLPLFVSALLAGSLTAEERMLGGPFAVNGAGRSATIGWVVQTGEVRAGGGRAVPVLRAEHVTLTDLKAGETVTYTLPNGATGSFKVPAPAGSPAFQAVVFGDTRTRHELHRRIIAAVEKLAPDFAVHTGDLVANGLAGDQWAQFLDIEQPLLGRTAFYPVLGNHERNSPFYHELFANLTPYYSFDWGRAHFTLIDSDLGNVALSAAAKAAFWAEQTRWMEDDLAKAQAAEFRFVVMHHPPFTAYQKRQGGNAEVRALVPLWERYRVTATFAGHDHNYQHHLVNGVHHLVTGGGGAPLYPADAPIAGTTVKAESTEHFVHLLVEPGKATVQAVAVDGHIIDTFELTAAPAPAAK